MKKKKSFTAWAINANSKEGHGFLGRHWWFYGDRIHIPEHLKGCRTALFQTRKLARKALRYDKTQRFVAFPKARVSKVRITIQEI